MDVNIEMQADKLVAKTKHYLITTMGRVLEEANSDEFYRALSYTLREEIMINWLAMNRTIAKQDARILYFLSMEYMPGRIMSNNISNLHANDIVLLILQKMNRTYDNIILHEREPGLGNGGLGRLASCFLDSLATQHYPAQAYGLRYQYGIFEQQLWEGVQIETPDPWLVNEYPWEFRRDLHKVFVKFCGKVHPTTNLHGDEIYQLDDYEQVWALPFDIPIVGYNRDNRFSVATLRLWSTKESPRNFQLQRYNAGRLDEAAENTTLTDVLYPSDHHDTGRRVRLKQEFLLVSASVQDIIRHYLENHHNFRDFADKVRIQINDTHPSLIIAELTRQLIQTYDLPWDTAVEITRECTGYTNHTILREALEQWDTPLMSYLLPQQHKMIERLNQDFCAQVREKFPNDEERVKRMSIIDAQGNVRMAHLAAYGSHSVNGVAALHSKILKETIFKDFDAMFPNRFTNVTNGVTQRRWLLLCNPDLARFITERIGDSWITDFMQIDRLAEFAHDPESQQEFLDIKRKNKQRLIKKIFKTEKMRNEEGEPTLPYPIVDVDSLFDVQVKRLHEYKRQLMNLLHLIMVYQEILSTDTKRIKRTAIIAGKAAAGYETAKDIIDLAHCIGRRINKDPATKDLLKVIFIENYNVSRAEIIIPAADLSEQISTAGNEASGTGNMKLTINGALTIGTNDGANIEMREEVTDKWWPFSFGCSAEEIEKMQREQSYHPKELYESDPRIKSALDSLVDDTFASTAQERDAFARLHRSLLASDRYFMLKDLNSYFETQKKVEQLYQDANSWAKFALHNIAAMGKFSTDYSIQNYCEKIWGLKPVLTDDEILERVRHDYSEHDQCRIY